MQTEKKTKILTVFLHALVWLIIVYCMKGCVTCYIKNVELWVYVSNQILNSQHVIIMCKIIYTRARCGEDDSESDLHLRCDNCFTRI